MDFSTPTVSPLRQRMLEDMRRGAEGRTLIENRQQKNASVGRRRFWIADVAYACVQCRF